MSSTDDPKKLFILKASNKPLTDVVSDFIKACQSLKTYALFYAPQHCYLALWEEREAKWKEGDKAVSLTAVYEARIFNEVAELRWHHDGAGLGRVVVITEREDLEVFDKAEPEGFLDTFEQRYLIWGESAGAANGKWTRFATARIGAFDVPVDTTKKEKQRAQFAAREYVQAEPEYGNAFVFEERLYGIELETKCEA